MGGGDGPYQIDRATPGWTAGIGDLGPVESTIARLGQEPEPDCESLECRASEPGRLSGRGYFRTLPRDPGSYEEGSRCLARDRGALAPPMTPPTNQIDEKLDQWGSRLFNVTTETTPRPRRTKRTPLGSAKPVSAGGRLSTSRARANYVRQKLQAMVRRTPQVVVKLVKAPKGMKGISNNLTYISRDGLLEIEDQDGQVIHGKEAVADLKTEWRDGGMPIAADSTMRDAFHLVLSMPQRTEPVSVQRAARDFAKREFSGFQYAMVLHTFETDPDPNPAPHPHVHLTVKAAGLDGFRLNPRKADLHRWREGFAEALREHGIEATTTSRIHRTTHERWKVRHLPEPSKKGGTLERLKLNSRRQGRAQEVMRNYEQVMRTLARSDRGEDRQLAADLVSYLGARGRTRETEKQRGKDRE